MPRLIPTLCFGLLTVSTARADITPGKAFDFLRFAELNVHVQMSFDDIDWIEDEVAANERLARLEAALAGDPRNLQAACELIELYDRFNRSSEAAAVAKRTLPAFKERLERDRDEASALSFAKAALAAKIRDEYDVAYRALQPYLESGRAGRDTCITAIGILMKGGDYGLAKRIAEHYLRIDPRFIPGLILTANLHIVSEEIRQAMAILENIPESEDPDLKSAILHTLGIARILSGEREAGTADLRRALELQPANQVTRDALQELGLDPDGQ